MVQSPGSAQETLSLYSLMPTGQKADNKCKKFNTQEKFAQWQTLLWEEQGDVGETDWYGELRWSSRAPLHLRWCCCT